MSARFLPAQDLDRLLDGLRTAGWRVVGPTVSDGAIVYDEIASAMDLPAGWVAETAAGEYRLRHGGTRRVFDYGLAVTAWKRFTHPPTVPLARLRRTDGHLEAESLSEAPPALAFLGVRACEIAALRIQDRALGAGPAGDDAHLARRAASLIVAVECARATATCFCVSTGAGPEIADGADIILRELDEGFVVEAPSDGGRSIVDRLGLSEARPEQVAAATRQVAAVRAGQALVAIDGVAARLRAALDSPRWSEIADRCLACANCTLVCPTCFCTSVTVASDLDGLDATTERRWDSCFSAGFARVAGDASFRPRVADRYRQWLTHKFSTWWDQFGSGGCVGCGRCIAWCPVGIDVREELAAIAPPAAPAGPIPWPVAPPDGRAPGPDVRRPIADHAGAVVARAVHETPDTVTLTLDVGDRSVLGARPGQFVLVEQPAFASPPISISRIHEGALELTIRAAGPATAALTALPPGSEVALRGPLGRGWPVGDAVGRDVVIVGGGIGLAPLRPVLDAILAERARFRALRIFVGARTPRDRLFVDELSALAGRTDLEIGEIVDRAGPDWFGRVGVVTQLFDHADWDAAAVTAFVCGPERMMQATAATLGSLGVPAGHTWLTLERSMACGVGTCGHCQLGPFFVCRDGPVFSLAELGEAFHVEGL
jgi:NAD(P)H-flavin reductase